MCARMRLVLNKSNVEPRREGALAAMVKWLKCRAQFFEFFSKAKRLLFASALHKHV